MIDDIFAKFDGAFAENTIRAYRSDFIQYQTWCLENSLAPILATADTVEICVNYLSEINKSDAKRSEVILALKRMHRKIGRTQQQATPLTKPLLK
jgi:site-specific recombinase XerD